MAPYCEARIVVTAKVAVWSVECGSWQSTQVACRFLFSTSLSFVACWLRPVGNGCPIFANSAKTLGIAGDIVEPPLWHEIQFWVAVSMFGIGCAGPVNNDTAPGALCGAWHERQPFCLVLP